MNKTLSTSITTVAVVVGSLFGRAVIRDMAVANVAAQPSMHERQLDAAQLIRQTLPKIIDVSTTLTDVQVDGTKLVYVYGITQDVTAATLDPVVAEQQRTKVTATACASSMRKVIENGGAYKYEYWHNGNFVLSFDVSSCQS